PADVIDLAIKQRRAALCDRNAASGSASASARPACQLIVAPLVRGSGSDVEVCGVLVAELDSSKASAAQAWGGGNLDFAACAAHLIGVSLEALEARAILARTNNALEERVGIPNFVGQTPAALAVIEFVNKVGRSDSTVLVYGESGVGKELVAHAIHK